MSERNLGLSRAGSVGGSALFFLQVVCLSVWISTVFSLLFAIEANATEDNIYTVSSVKVYSEANENSSVTANLIVGNAFEVYEAVNDDSGIVWYLISTDFGAAGYVKADELDALIAQTQAAVSTAEVAAENQEADEQAAADNAADNAVDNTEVPADNAVTDIADTNNINDNADLTIAADNDDTQDERTAEGTLLVSSSVNLRSEPNADSAILTMINEDTELVYFGWYENDDGEGWYEVESDGMTGYITESVVELVTETAGQEEEAVSQGTQTAEVQNTQEQTQELQTQEQTDSEFEVSGESTQTVKSKSGFRIDLVAIGFIVGVLACIAAIAVLIRKILKLLRL